MDEFAVQGNMNRSYSWGLKGKEINIDLPVWDPTLHCCVALSEFEVEGLLILN